MLLQRYKLVIAYDGTNFCGWQKQEPPVGSGVQPSATTCAVPEVPGDLNDEPNQQAADQLNGHNEAPLPPTSGGHAGNESKPANPNAAAGACNRIPINMIVGELPATSDKPARYQLRTVQHMVEHALRSVVREQVVLSGSSRTDAGVHARAQVAAFSCGCEARGSERTGGWPLARGIDRLMLAVNGRLPEDVRVVSVAPTHGSFNPSMDVLSKSYSYTIHSARTRPLWDRHFVHYTYERLNAAAMQEAAEHLEGEHDFTSFAASGHGRASTVRTIFSCRVSSLPVADDAGGFRVRIDVSGNGFLWNMVRILAGTLLRVGLGRFSPGQMAAILAAKDRRAAGATLPPTGLCLEEIVLKPSDQPPDPYEYVPWSEAAAAGTEQPTPAPPQE